MCLSSSHPSNVYVMGINDNLDLIVMWYLNWNGRTQSRFHSEIKLNSYKYKAKTKRMQVSLHPQVRQSQQDKLISKNKYYSEFPKKRKPRSSISTSVLAIELVFYYRWIVYRKFVIPYLVFIYLKWCQNISNYKEYMKSIRYLRERFDNHCRNYNGSNVTKDAFNIRLLYSSVTSIHFADSFRLTLSTLRITLSFTPMYARNSLICEPIK